MRRTIAGHFDGKVIIPEKPVLLPLGKRLRIEIEVEGPTKPGRGRRTLIGAGKFASGVGDLSTNKKHLEGFGKE